jgi:hypothetical protein
MINLEIRKNMKSFKEHCNEGKTFGINNGMIKKITDVLYKHGPFTTSEVTDKLLILLRQSGRRIKRWEIEDIRQEINKLLKELGYKSKLINDATDNVWHRYDF